MRTTVEGVQVDTRHWIGGRRVESATTFTDVSPIDEQPLAEIAAGGTAEVDAAVTAAQEAFPRWAGLDVAERSAILRRVADGIEARVEDLARVETRDNGSLLRSHRRGVMPRSAMNFRFFADYAEKLAHPDGEIRGHRERVTYDPAGVTAIITPWNAPLMLATWRIGPALAAGNTVVAKPPEWAPLTASLLADITAEAGLPPGVLQRGPGHRRAGRGPADRAPGHSSAVVHRLRADGRGDRAERRPRTSSRCRSSWAASRRWSCSPTPTSTSRCPWPSSSSTTPGRCAWGRSGSSSRTRSPTGSSRRCVERAGTIVQGDPRDEATDISCLISRPHFEKVDGFVQRAKQDGARAVLGGSPNDELGHLYYRPTILVDAGPAARSSPRRSSARS